MKKRYFWLFIFSGVISIQAQEVAWQKDISSSTQDFLSQLCITIDGQYLVSGSSIKASKMTSVSSAGSAKQNNGYDFHVMKLNQQGEDVWEKYFSGNRHDYLAATTATKEGGFLLAGTSYSSLAFDKKEKSFGGSDLWLIKLNENGEEEWQKTIGTAKNEEAKSVVQTMDLGYFVGGDVNGASQGFGGKDALIIKLDKTGKVISQTMLGGTGSDEVEKMIPTKDGGVLLGIYSRSGIPLNPPKEGSPTTFKTISKTSQNFGEGDYWIVKLNKDGALQWQKNFGGKDDDRIKTLSFFEDGFLIGGESRSSSSGNKQPTIKEGTDLWFIALNENGDEIWQKSYSFGNRDVVMSQNTINDASGNKTKGFLIGGYTQAEEKISKNDETFWMLYLDNKGDEVWRKHIEGKSKQKEERLVDAKLQNDGSFILAGTSAPELGKENWKILKLADKDVENLIEKQEIRIYPNPVEDYCYVEIGFDFTGEAEILLHDMSGRKMQTIKTKNKVTKLNTTVLPQGVYVVTGTTSNKVVNTKIVKK